MKSNVRLCAFAGVHVLVWVRLCACVLCVRLCARCVYACVFAHMSCPRVDFVRCACACALVCLCACAHVCMLVCLHMCVRALVRLCACVYMRVYVTHTFGAARSSRLCDVLRFQIKLLFKKQNKTE